MSSNTHPFHCKAHDQSWHLLSQLGEDLCAKCCQHIWSSSYESDSSRKELLSQLDSSLRYGSKLSITLSDSKVMASGETHSFVVSITGLVYHSDPHIRHLSKNCLNLLKTQINEKSIIESIFEDIVKNISCDKVYWNDCSFDLMAELMADICLATHPLRDDIDILFRKFHFEFNRLNDSLKTSLLRIFNEFYVNSESNQLFAFDNDFHLKTLSMIFNTFEALNSHSNDRQLILKSIELMRRLAKIESIVKSITTDPNLIHYFRLLLNDKCIDIKSAALELMADLLDEVVNSNQYIRRSLALTLHKQMMDSFIEHLNSSPNISIPLLDCLHLILDNTRKTKSETKLGLLSKSVIKSLQFSVTIKDDKHFGIALSVLKQIIENNSNSEIHFLNEFDFFLVLDLMESCIWSPFLFTKIVSFCAQFFNLQIVPILIPTQRMKMFFTKILANVSQTESDNSLERTTGAVKLIKSYLNLINTKKNKEFDPNTKEPHFLNVEKQWNSDDIDLEEFHENENSKEISKRTEIYEFLSFCLEQIETLLAIALEKLLSERYLDHNLELFEEICLCFEIVIKNDLFVGEDISHFIEGLFSKGYVLSVLQLLWSSEYPSNSESFVSNLSSLLSYFVTKIRDFQQTNQLKPKDIKIALIESKDKFSDLSIDFCDYLTEVRNKRFVDTFFAINYFSHIFLSKEELHEMDVKYSEIFLKVLNTYLQNNLSEEIDSIPTIKYSLFLSSLCYLEDTSLEALQQFFEHKEKAFYSKYYTNHMKLLLWLFSDLKCDRFCEFALKIFIKDMPKSYLNYDEKHKISSFFQLICDNERALQILIDTLCDTSEDNPTIEVILKIIEDCDQFIDDSIIYNNWQRFCDQICEQIETIFQKLIDKIEDIISCGITWNIQLSDEDDIDIINPDSIGKVIKLLKFLCRLLSNEMISITFIQFESFGDKFNELIEKFCQFIDKHLDDFSVKTIFQFFRVCLNSNRYSQIIEELLTKHLLDSKIGVNLLFNYVNNDLPTDDGTNDADNKETALFILSVLSHNKYSNNFNHQFVYKLDINRLMNLLNSESKVVTESAFILLRNSFKTKLYFESNEKSEEIKIEEMRRLLFCLQNAVFRQNITLTQISTFLSEFFKNLKDINRELMQDLANNRWFQVIIDHYLEADEPNQDGVQQIEGLPDVDTEDEEELDEEEGQVITISDKQRRDKKIVKQKRRQTRVFREDFIDFLLVFFRLNFVNTALIGVMNEMTKLFVKFLDRHDDQMSEYSSLRDKALKAVKTINFGVYSNHLTQQNRKQLNILSQKILILNIINEHNYCVNTFID